MPGYTYKEIQEAYTSVGVRRGATVCLRTHLAGNGPYVTMRPRTEILEAHYQALAEMIDLDEGTLVVSTASTSLCNTETVFDPETTRSEMGALTEYIRTRPGAVRSLHPFASYAAIGKNANHICRNTSRHAYGLETPCDRLLGLDALEVHLGQQPRFMCSLVHQAEILMGVPYRYTKEFIHPVRLNGTVESRSFFLYVYYRNCGIERDSQDKLFRYLGTTNMKIAEAPLGSGLVYGFSSQDYFRGTIAAMKEDPFIWLKSPLSQHPFRE